ncbi:hypothetical protein QE373_000829 [Stenotrophomonas sp. SORGH_AS321]|nr:hypothetical protein [Stenotrophomonas sp. SORGH_AS_0321]
MRHAHPPPVPQKVCDMLRDFPAHTAKLQADLNRVAEKPLTGTPMFEQAIWALEEALSCFAVDAREELKAAQDRGDLDLVERAKWKALKFGYARANMGSMPDLYAYFNARGLE